MTSPPDKSVTQAGAEGGAYSPLVLTALDSDVCRDMRWCINCGGEKVFVEVFEFDGGRMGVCLGCGEERVEPFTRTTTEAA
jgi:hypothetical protein